MDLNLNQKKTSQGASLQVAQERSTLSSINLILILIQKNYQLYFSIFCLPIKLKSKEPCLSTALLQFNSSFCIQNQLRFATHICWLPIHLTHDSRCQVEYCHS